MREATYRVVGYTRLSKDNGCNGAGLAVQEQAIREACQQRNWQLAEIVQDRAATGGNVRREGLIRALSLLNTGDVLMVAKLDRLSRSVGDFADLTRQASREGWSVVVLDPAMDMTTPAGEAMANMLMTFAQFERRLIGQRIKEVLAVKRAEGVQLGRPRSIPDHIRERIVRERVDGSTLQAIADRLNADGVPTTKPDGRWIASTVRSVLRQMEGD